VWLEAQGLLCFSIISPIVSLLLMSMKLFAEAIHDKVSIGNRRGLDVAKLLSTQPTLAAYKIRVLTHTTVELYKHTVIPPSLCALIKPGVDDGIIL
jgi:hypothetical protein